MVVYLSELLLPIGCKLSRVIPVKPLSLPQLSNPRRLPIRIRVLRFSLRSDITSIFVNFIVQIRPICELNSVVRRTDPILIDIILNLNLFIGLLESVLEHRVVLRSPGGRVQVSLMA